MTSTFVGSAAKYIYIYIYIYMAAGTPFADLMYSLAMSRVLKTMRRSLLNEGLVTSLEVPDTGNVIPLDDVSFVDDMALPIACPAKPSHQPHR